MNSLLSSQQQQQSQSQMSLHHNSDENGTSSGQHMDSHFDPTSSHDDFLQQILSSVPSSSTWPDISGDGQHHPYNFDDQSTLLASKLRQHQINGGAAKALMLQQQLLLSRGNGDQNDDITNPGNGISALYNGFSGSLGQTSNQSQHFLHAQGGSMATQSLGTMNQTAGGASGGGSGQAKQQKVRARRGQATDPHSIAERLRRERIAERMKALQELVPNANKTDKASMLDEIIDYVKFLQLQVKGGECVKGNGGGRGMTMTEQQVAKLMEEDMGSAMQYLQGKGLCLMPISLATAISTTTCHPMNTNPLLGETCGPSSPSLSASTVQSATMGLN